MENRKTDTNLTSSSFSIPTGIFTVILLVVVGGIIFIRDNQPNDYYLNLFTEFVSLVATVGVLNALAKHRENKRILEQLIIDAGIPVQSIAVSAVTKLKLTGYLVGAKSVLNNKHLPYTDLTKAHLEDCYFEYTTMEHAKLDNCHLQRSFLRHSDFSHASARGVNLTDAKLSDSEFFQTDLTGTTLTYADLSRANFVEANLSHCDLSRADLRGTNMLGANLTNAKIEDPICDASTILPDGQPWSHNAQWSHFILGNY